MTLDRRLDSMIGGPPSDEPAPAPDPVDALTAPEVPEVEPVQVAGLGQVKKLLEPLFKPGARSATEPKIIPPELKPVVEPPAVPAPKDIPPAKKPPIELELPSLDEMQAIAKARENAIVNSATGVKPAAGKPPERAFNTEVYDDDGLAATVNAVADHAGIDYAKKSIRSIYQEALAHGMPEETIERLLRGLPMSANVGDNGLATMMARTLTVWDESGKKLDSMFQALSTGALDDAGKLDLRRQVAIHEMLGKSVKNQQVDVARTMNVFKRVRDAGPGLDTKALREALDTIGTDAELLNLADKWLNSPTKAGKNLLVERSMGGKAIDAIYYTAQSNMLNDPATWARNIAGSMISGVLQPAARLASIPVGRIRTMIPGSDPDRYKLDDFYASSYGVYNAFLDGLVLAGKELSRPLTEGKAGLKADAFRENPLTADFWSSVPAPGIGLIDKVVPGFGAALQLGKTSDGVFRTPDLRDTPLEKAFNGLASLQAIAFRALSVPDDFFGGIAARTQLHGEAWTFANKEYDRLMAARPTSVPAVRPPDARSPSGLQSFGYTADEIARMSPQQLRDTNAAMSMLQKDAEFRSSGIHASESAAERLNMSSELQADIAAGRIEPPKGGLKIPVQTKASGYAPGSLDDAEKELLEWADGDRAKAIQSLKTEIDDGRFVDGESGVYNQDLLLHMEKPPRRSPDPDEYESEVVREVQRQVERLLTERPATMQASIDGFRNQVTFQTDMSSYMDVPILGTAYSNIVKFLDHPAIKWLSMFNHTLSNIFIEGTAWTPGMNFISPRFWQDFNAGGGQRDLAVTRVAMGGATMLSAGFLAWGNRVSGYGPSQTEDREALMKTGWLPYSWRFEQGEVSQRNIDRLSKIFPVSVGDEGHVFVQYNRMGLEPLSFIFGSGADIADAAKFHTGGPSGDDILENDAMELFKVGALASSNYMTNLPLMQGIGNITKILRSRQEDKGDQLVEVVSEIGKQVGTVGLMGTPVVGLANSTLMAHIESLFDPRRSNTMPPVADVEQPMRAFYEVLQRFRSRVPGMSKDVPELLDHLGRPKEVVTFRDHWLNWTPNVTARTGKRSEVDELLVSLNFGIHMPPRKMDGVAMSGEQYNRYLQLYGQEIKLDGMNLERFIPQMISKAEEDAMTAGEVLTVGDKQKLIMQFVGKYRTLAKMRLIGDPEGLPVPGDELGLAGDKIEFPDLQKLINGKKRLGDIYGR